MDIVIDMCTVEQFFNAPNLDAIMLEYAQEASLPELGQAKPQKDIYAEMEQSGHLYPIAAWESDLLVGFIVPLALRLPHYGVAAVTVESFFVQTRVRDKGVGLRLLAGAEHVAMELEAKALLISAPANGILAKVLPRKGYRCSNNTFIKALR